MSELIIFPVERESRLIQRAAINLERRTSESAERWWRTECHRLYGRYVALGLSEVASRSLIDRYARAVQAELNRRAHQQRGGGAA